MLQQRRKFFSAGQHRGDKLVGKDVPKHFAAAFRLAFAAIAGFRTDCTRMGIGNKGKSREGDSDKGSQQEYLAFDYLFHGVGLNG